LAYIKEKTILKMEAFCIKIPPVIIREQAAILLEKSGIFEGNLSDITSAYFPDKVLKNTFLAFIWHRFRRNTTYENMELALHVHIQTIERLNHRMNKLSEDGENEFNVKEEWKKMQIAESYLPSIFETKFIIKGMVERNLIDVKEVKAQRKRRPVPNRFEIRKAIALRKKVASLFNIATNEVISHEHALTMYIYYLQLILPETSYKVLEILCNRERSVMYYYNDKHHDNLAMINSKNADLKNYRINSSLVEESLLFL
jgi:hypothetical protein